MVSAMYWLVFDIAQRVMHPAHVPFQVEAQILGIVRGGVGDTRPGGGFFGDGEGVWVQGVNAVVERAQKFQGVDVFTAAVAVGQPFTLFAGEVEVKHGGNSIDAQPVDVVFFQPEEGVADEKLTDFITAVIKNIGPPIRMCPQARIFMFIEMGAIKETKAMLIHREVGRHPIQNHANFGLMASIDKGHEIIGRAEAAGRGKVASHLVAPGAVKRMFRDGQQLNVSVAHLLDVGN